MEWEGGKNGGKESAWRLRRRKPNELWREEVKQEEEEDNNAKFYTSCRNRKPSASYNSTEGLFGCGGGWEGGRGAELVLVPYSNSIVYLSREIWRSSCRVH